MAGGWTLLVLALHLFLQVNADCAKGFVNADSGCVDLDECVAYNDPEDPPCINGQCKNTYGSFECSCHDGFKPATAKECKDINECEVDRDICGPTATCVNKKPFYSCFCQEGFVPSNGKEGFQKGENVTCEDRDECEIEDCGPNAACVNTKGGYHCVCNNGFRLASGNKTFSGPPEECRDICELDKTICGNGTCLRGPQGHHCACHAGYTNYGNHQSRCTEQHCDELPDLSENNKDMREFFTHLRSNCLQLANSSSATHINGDDMLETMLSVIDSLFSAGAIKDPRKISTLLDLVELAVKMIGPFIKPPGKKMSSFYADMEMRVHIGEVPQKNVTLSALNNNLQIHMQTAAGDPSVYPGFTMASALSYTNLENYTNDYVTGITAPQGTRLKMNSKVMTVTVSNRDTKQLEMPVFLRFEHLKQSNDTHTCVFWNSSEEGGRWSQHGCHVVENTSQYTLCSCNHLSSFAVLMALVEVEDQFELRLITWMGLSLSLVCLFVCILTFSLIRSIQSPRTTIHLHLCINLFLATLIFLVGISRTENKVGCAVIAGLLHFFYLAAFCWMCLEGVQLFRMVVLVFNTSFKTLYMMAAGYGVPALIVAVSAATNPKGYGTERYCWLRLNFMWTFFGPVCVIIAVNIVFFFITVWKLAQKFSSLNPELDKLQKIRTFIITAVAQLSLLGTMWVFGCFQFMKDSIIMAYLFTISGSLQGVLLFVMHCLLSKQVTDEYRNSLTALCSPPPTKYSDFSYVYSSKAPTSKSSQGTGESQT
ncbi:adhesion G protein-coupled receptor E1-like [Synchiropus splendidus]|uniref:adhesion G protein-coupled receptor E1-like n=1 Tax=Synchiropus splendidus TaxID=270530 RepID=UPI00237EA95A|nr:adhesion G protein-coupled receptor E1-like [Synchiropus splendidus]